MCDRVYGSNGNRAEIAEVLKAKPSERDGNSFSAAFALATSEEKADLDGKLSPS